MDCRRIERDEMAEAYLGGRLSAADQADFERHAFECPRCFDRLRALQAVQAELWEQGSSEAVRSTESKPVWTRRWVLVPAAALILMLAGAALWWQLGGPGRRAATSSRYASLAAFEPPAYLPLALRAGTDKAAERFQAGMEQYMAGRYDAAIRELHAAESINPAASHVLFFLGVSYLLNGQTGPGISRLEKVVSLGDPAYAVEARFYLAKAWLRKGNAAKARAEFQAVSVTGSRLAAEAVRLLALIEK